ncbi:MAG: hypothetical protein WDM86_20685 [Rhizomicrobium sp.]
MTEEELLALKFGNGTVADNIQRAVDAGHLVREQDGRLRLTSVPSSRTNWVIISHGPSLDCQFKARFLFPHVYAEAAVPFGCSGCYKVKVAPRTLRELVAVWGVGKRIECYSKWGVDLDNPYSGDIYAGYFYTVGLEGARATYRVVREIIDAHPLLGPGVAMSIKRGCSEYEAALGPSDRYSFAPELEELEAYLRTRFHKATLEGVPPLPMAHWIDVAFRIGDETYLDFTHGKRLRPKTVAYEP